MVIDSNGNPVNVFIPSTTRPVTGVSQGGFGDANRRGWNVGAVSVYDYKMSVMQYATGQVTYNTDCCGLSVQYRRVGIRGENQWRVAFSVANIGSFGTLRKQDRIF